MINDPFTNSEFPAAPKIQTDDPFNKELITYNNSFSGSDLQCIMFMPMTPEEKVAHRLSAQASPTTYKVFAELQTITVSSHRNVFPVRRLGESHAYTYTRGARTIAGTLVFSILNRDVMAEFYRRSGSEISMNAPFFVDQIPPFSITAIAENEYGGVASAVLVNIHLTNFGQTMSVDDIFMESTYSYVAEHYYPFVDDPIAFLQRRNAVSTMPNDPPASKAILSKVPRNKMPGFIRDGVDEAERDAKIIDDIIGMPGRFDRLSEL